MPKSPAVRRRSLRTNKRFEIDRQRDQLFSKYKTAAKQAYGLYLKPEEGWYHHFGPLDMVYYYRKGVHISLAKEGITKFTGIQSMAKTIQADREGAAAAKTTRSVSFLKQQLEMPTPSSLEMPYFGARLIHERAVAATATTTMAIVDESQNPTSAAEILHQPDQCGEDEDNDSMLPTNDQTIFHDNDDDDEEKKEEEEEDCTMEETAVAETTMPNEPIDDETTMATTEEEEDVDGTNANDSSSKATNEQQQQQQQVVISPIVVTAAVVVVAADTSMDHEDEKPAAACEMLLETEETSAPVADTTAVAAAVLASPMPFHNGTADYHQGDEEKEETEKDAATPFFCSTTSKQYVRKAPAITPGGYSTCSHNSSATNNNNDNMAATPSPMMSSIGGGDTDVDDGNLLVGYKQVLEWLLEKAPKLHPANVSRYAACLVNQGFNTVELLMDMLDKNALLLSMQQQQEEEAVDHGQEQGTLTQQPGVSEQHVHFRYLCKRMEQEGLNEFV